MEKVNRSLLLAVALFFEIISPIFINIGLLMDQQVSTSHKIIITGLLWLAFGTLIWVTLVVFMDVAKAITEEEK